MVYITALERVGWDHPYFKKIELPSFRHQNWLLEIWLLPLASCVQFSYLFYVSECQEFWNSKSSLPFQQGLIWKTKLKAFHRDNIFSCFETWSITLREELNKFLKACPETFMELEQGSQELTASRKLIYYYGLEDEKISTVCVCRGDKEINAYRILVKECAIL